MLEARIEIDGLNRLKNKLGAVEGTRFMAGVLNAVGADAKDALATPPGPVHHPIRWTSEKQRRYYFAMRRKRGLPLKYTRESDPMSEKLLGGWNQRSEDGGMTVIVGTRASYARFAMDERYQQGFHKDTGWKTIQQHARELMPKLRKKAAQALRRVLG